jgi:hypothetical protein
MRRLLAYTLSALMVLFATFAAPQVQAHESNWDRTIVGTWIVTTTFNTPPGTPPFVSHEFASFHPGGTYLGNFAFDRNSANPFAPPPFQVDFSTKYGTWKQKWPGSPHYSLVLQEYMFAGPLTPAAIYGEFYPGMTVGIATVRVPLTMNQARDTLTGPFTVEFRNNAGDVVFTGSGTVIAKRQQ